MFLLIVLFRSKQVIFRQKLLVFGHNEDFHCKPPVEKHLFIRFPPGNENFISDGESDCQFY